MSTLKKRRTRSATACSKCRGMKVRCDVVSRFPNKCTRCERSKVFCELDRQLRKTSPPVPTETHVAKLRREDPSFPSSASYPYFPSANGATMTATTTVNTSPSLPVPVPAAVPAAPAPVPGTSPTFTTTYLPTSHRTLQDQVLSNGTVIPVAMIHRLFAIFLKHQYQYLPIFPKRYLSPSFLLLNDATMHTTVDSHDTVPTRSSPVLFWTICAIACPMAFHHQRCISQESWNAIAIHTRQLLQQHNMVTHYVLRPFATLAHIYALVLLCEWPLPHRTTQEDLTWIYSGQAVHIGLLIGLHRSWFKSEYVIVDADNTANTKNNDNDNDNNNTDTNNNDNNNSASASIGNSNNSSINGGSRNSSSNSSRQRKEEKKEQRARTQRARTHALMWMACFHINQRLASIHGVPATATLDYSLYSLFTKRQKESHQRQQRQRRRHRRKRVFTGADQVNGNHQNNDVDDDDDDDDDDDERALTEFLKQVHILHLLNRCINTLGIDTNATFDYTVISGHQEQQQQQQQQSASNGMVDPSCRRIIHSSLEAAMSQLGVDHSPMSVMTELIYLHAKVQLHSFLLAPDSLDRDKMWVVMPISIVCMQIVQLVHKSLEQDKQLQGDGAHHDDDGDDDDYNHNDGNGQTKKEDGDEPMCFHCWPNFVTRTLLISSVILFRLSTSVYKPWLDLEAVQQALVLSRSLFTKLSWSATCPAARAARVLDGLSMMATEGALSETDDDLSFSQSRLGSGFWGVMMAYKKWVLQKQKEQEQELERSRQNAKTTVPATVTAKRAATVSGAAASAMQGPSSSPTATTTTIPTLVTTTMTASSVSQSPPLPSSLSASSSTYITPMIGEAHSQFVTQTLLPPSSPLPPLSASSTRQSPPAMYMGNSNDELFSSIFSFDDHDHLSNWNDLSWLDNYNPR